MLITNFYGTPVKDMTWAGLMDAFTERTFFEFMAQGREGVTASAHEFVNTIVYWLVENGKIKKNEDGIYMTSDEAHKVVLDVQRFMIDGFIRGGTSGLRSELQAAFTIVLNTVNR